MRPILALLLILLATACQSTYPENSAIADVDAFARTVVKTIPEVPSLGVAIVYGGKRHAHTYGFADLDKQTPATPQTTYYVASTTKAFTGLTAAILAERGTIDLDAPVTKYLPELKFASDIDANAITLRRLLSHTALIDNDPITFRTAYTGEHSPAMLVNVLASSKPRKEGFQYDNLGYVIASLVFERATGRAWQDLHDQHVFMPLGMQRATDRMSEARQLATPYDITRGGALGVMHYRKNDQMMHAAGGTVLSTEDLARWLEANVHAGRVGGRQAVSARAIAETQRKHATVAQPHRTFGGTAYGFGWYEGLHGSERVLYHGGGFEGWRALFTFMPDKQIGVGVMANSGVANPVTLLVAQYAYDRLLGKANVDAEYAEKLAKIRSDVDAAKAKFVADVQRRAERAWQLRNANASYVGRYENPLYGAMTIEERDGKLFASIGPMHSMLEAFTEPETARVELVPSSGEVLRFSVANGRSDAVTFRDEVFRRTP